jgi:ribosomal protein L37E
MDATYSTGNDTREFTPRCAYCGQSADTVRLGTPRCAPCAWTLDCELDADTRCTKCGAPDPEHVGFCALRVWPPDETGPAWEPYDDDAVPHEV